MQLSLLYTSITVFYSKNKFSKVLNGDVHRTSTGPSCETSWRPNGGTFRGRPRDVSHKCFLNPTQKHIKLTLTVNCSSEKSIEKYSD